MKRGMIAAGHEETAHAAKLILEAGGNAFDAIVAAGFTAPISEPVLTSLGGGGFLLAHPDSGSEFLYDFFVQTPLQLPKGKDLDFYPIQANFGRTIQEFHIGLGSCATPGMAAGFLKVHEELGSLPLKEVLAPAIELGRKGIRINAFQEYLFSVVFPIYTATPEAREIFHSGSHSERLVMEGDQFSIPEYSDTLEILGREGRDFFYRGELAKKIMEQAQEGGVLTMEDLENYQVIKRAPLEFYYRGHRLITNPPPSSGGILIEFCLELLEPSEEPKTQLTGEDYLRLVYAMEYTNRARQEAHADNGSLAEVALVLRDKKFLKKYREEVAGHFPANRGTTHLNVVDSKGNVASMSLSNGEGCGSIVPGTGIMLNNMLGEEDINPKGFHQWTPDQRMSSMMSPTVLFEKNGTVIALGSGGSNRIRTAIVQVLWHLMDNGEDLPSAVNASRIHYERELLSIEPGLSPKILEKLCQEIPKNHLWKDKNLFFGGVHGAGFHPGKGFLGAGDPRRHGVCVEA